MLNTLIYLVWVVAFPTLLFVRVGRTVDGARAALVVAALATWAAVTVVMAVLGPAPGRFMTAVIYYLAVLPALAVPLSAFVATRLVRPRARLAMPLLLSFAGWMVGLTFAYLGHAPASTSTPLWLYAHILVVPAVYAACGAVVAIGLDAQRV